MWCRACNTHEGGRRNEYKILIGKPEGMRHLWWYGGGGGDLTIQTIKNGMWGYRLGSCGSGHGPVANSCKTEPSGFIRGAEFIHKLSYSRLCSRDKAVLFLKQPSYLNTSPPGQYARMAAGTNSYWKLTFGLDLAPTNAQSLAYLPPNLQLPWIHTFRSSATWGIQGRNYDPWNFTFDNAALLPTLQNLCRIWGPHSGG
jgi:hypothetical protein